LIYHGILRKLGPLRRSTSGAALVEYAIMIAALVVIVPAVALYGDKIPPMFDRGFGISAPEGTSGGIQKVAAKECVSTGQCPADPGVIDWCVETYGYGVVCGDLNIMVIEPSEYPRLVVPIPILDDLSIQWARTERNEDYNPDVYANTANNGPGNTAALVGHSISHPAADFCNARGMYLPSAGDLARMAPYHKELKFYNKIYVSSSQYWSTGNYNPPPVLRAINYSRTFDFYKYSVGDQPLSIGYPTHSFPVRCVY